MTLNGRPTTDAQWAREVEKRLRALERPRMVTLGPWQVSVSPISGDLIADHIPTMAGDPRVGTAYTIGYMKALVQNAHALGPARTLMAAAE